LLIGLMMSKSLIDAGVVRDNGAAEDCRGDSGPEGLKAGLAVELRRRLRLIDTSRVKVGGSRAVTSGDIGGVTMNLGSRKFWTDLRFLIVAGLPSSRFIGGGPSSGDDEATIGAASARGDDTDEGVDERVCSDWRPYAGTEEQIGTEELGLLVGGVI
jgi:hypothetical protein